MKKTILFLSAFAMMIVFAACSNDSTAENAGGDATAAESQPTAPANNASATESTNANTSTNVPSGPTTTVEFETPTYDFGTVAEGEKVKYAYKFKNTGSEPLVISNAKGSCGCTVPNWPREPIAPGGTGEIMVEFDTKGKGKEGGQKQTKRVTVTGNTDPANTFLTITGTVEKPAS